MILSGRRYAVAAALLSFVLSVPAVSEAQLPAGSATGPLHRPDHRPAASAVAAKPAPASSAASGTGGPSAARSATAPPTGVAASTAQKAIPLTPFADLFARLAGGLERVVVNISTTEAASQSRTAEAERQAVPGSPLDEFFRDFFGEKGAPGGPNSPAPPITSLGSGFIIDPSGLIVTNNHVVANAERITVTLSDDTALAAKVIGRDPVTDLALLKVDPKSPLPAAAWGDSTRTRVGDWVLAIGNPFGLGGTATAGIISATARDLHSGPYDFLQTDASINRGNSGGPMFNLAGQVIGINTAIFSPSGGSIGIGFAIPSALAQRIVAQLKATGRIVRGWIGARIQPVTDDLAESVSLKEPRGAMIASIDPGSPAAQARLQPGDVILTYDRKAIGRSRQLPRLVADTTPGTVVTLGIWRNSKDTEVKLQVAALDTDHPPPPAAAAPKPKPPPIVEALGLRLANLTPELRKQLSLPDGEEGVVVIGVPPNGLGSAQGLRPGDLVVEIGHTSVATLEQLQRAAAAAAKTGRKKVLVRVERGGNPRFVALPSGAG